MRVWDLPVQYLCRAHLLGQHREIHAIYSIIVNSKRGYANHPEVNRWRQHLGHLTLMHNSTAGEMIRRGYHHSTPMNLSMPISAPLPNTEPRPITSIREQIERLRGKRCGCQIAALPIFAALNESFIQYRNNRGFLDRRNYAEAND